MNYYKEIKYKLLDNEANKRVKNYLINRSELYTYYEVGKMLFEAGKEYGEDIIGYYSNKLCEEIGKKYTPRTLRRYRQFYNIFKDKKWSAMPTKLNWSQIQELLPLKDYNEIDYYIKMCETNNYTFRQLREKIKSKEYDRLPETTKNKLINKEEISIQDNVKNPIIINNPENIEIINELALHKLILNDIEGFMNNLGEAYSFIGNEYKIKIGNSYNYIDFLLFNYYYNCFVVVELKITKLKKEHIGQIQIYMNYCDEYLKKNNHNKTIGIIVCKESNKYIVKYSSNENIIAREYILLE